MRGGEFSRLIDGYRAPLRDNLTEVRKARAESGSERAALAERLASSTSELVASLLPTLDDEHLQRAAALCGYTPLTQRGRLEGEEDAALARQIADIEAEPAFRDRQLLRAPRVGTLSRAIDELVEFRGPLAEVIARCAHPRLDRLMESGYGTPRYDTPFWRLSYYSDWEAGDAIVARFPGKTFAAVREEFLSACQTVQVYDERLRQLRAEVAAGEALEQRHDELVRARAALPTEHLSRARLDLGAYLLDSDAVMLGERFANEPAHLGLLKRVLGLKKQSEYLERSADTLLGNEEAALQRELDKADQQVEKFQRPKNAGAAVPDDLVQQTQQRLQTRIDKTQHRQQEYHQTRAAVVGFDRYESARLTSDFLWWDLMTGGRLHGGYIPEVVSYRERYPHGSALFADDGDADWMNAAAAAAQARRAARRGPGAQAQRDTTTDLS